MWPILFLLILQTCDAYDNKTAYSEHAQRLFCDATFTALTCRRIICLAQTTNCLMQPLCLPLKAYSCCATTLQRRHCIHQLYLQSD